MKNFAKIKNMKLFSEKCCELLLQFTNNNDLRKNYFRPNFDPIYFEYLKQESSLLIPEELVLNPNSEDDCENSIKIFEALKDIDLVQANDRRLWVTLTHTIFFQYSNQRWIREENSDKKIIRRFHFEGTSIEARMRNSISRLWWAAKISYDQSRRDPYELTRLLWSKQDIYQNLVERSYGTYNSVVKGFLEFYFENNYLKEDQLRRLFTALNSIGGVKALSVHSKEEIKNILSSLITFYNFKIAA